ncbi:unnamed protein product [Prorocentrum cordatum]|uniref:Nocturnin n=1 Tax=Prorocentrum cordatum TaxID=2364126 RepID=A0ABN9QYZ5_9DINO|nr:unnamed protein product [Polarella glacialis]
MARQKIDMQHVHAHGNNPWKEVADAASNRGRIAAAPVQQQEWASIMDGTYQRDWEFLLDADENTKEAYPNFAHGSLTATYAPAAANASHLHMPTEASDRRTEIEINIATFNIQTGREPKEGAKRRSENINKLKTTMASLYDEDLHIIGFQKAREPLGMRDSDKEGDASCANANSYRVISSGHEGYNYGCELHHHTWHSGKNPRRIDYVVIPNGYVDSIEACSVLYGIDNGCDPDSKDDRYPVKLELAREIAASTSKGAPKLDEHNLADDACRKEFSDKLRDIPAPDMG